MTSATLTILLLILGVLNAAATAALIRQVGLLHLRIRPVSALITEEGPKIGDYLVFDRQPWELEGLGTKPTRYLLAFVSPTCRLCHSLLNGLQALGKLALDDTAVVYVTDVELDRGQEYLRSHGLVRPLLIADEGSSKRNKVPGTPYVAVVTNAGRVLAAGGVNTLEQIELLLEDSELQLSSTNGSLDDESERHPTGHVEHEALRGR